MSIRMVGIEMIQETVRNIEFRICVYIHFQVLPVSNTLHIIIVGLGCQLFQVNQSIDPLHQPMKSMRLNFSR